MSKITTSLLSEVDEQKTPMVFCSLLLANGAVGTPRYFALIS